MHQLLGQAHIVIAEKDNMRAHQWLADEADPFMNQGSPGLVFRMRLAGDNQLHRAIRVGQQTQQTGRIVQQQIGPFITGEAAGKTECQCLGVKHLPRSLDLFGQGTTSRQLPGQALAGVINQRRARSSAELPQPLIGHAAHILGQLGIAAQPAVFAANLGP